MGLGGVAIAILPSIICLKLTFSDGLGGYYCTGNYFPLFQGRCARLPLRSCHTTLLSDYRV